MPTATSVANPVKGQLAAGNFSPASEGYQAVLQPGVWDLQLIHPAHRYDFMLAVQQAKLKPAGDIRTVYNLYKANPRTLSLLAQVQPVEPPSPSNDL